MEIFRLSSTPVKVHWTLAAIIAFIAGWQYTMFGAADAFIVVVAALCLFGSVLIHEIAHSLVAKDFGYETEIEMRDIYMVDRMIERKFRNWNTSS